MKLKKISLSLFAVLAAISFSSCEKIFEDEGDCKVKYYVQFIYDMNLKWADAFPSEVNSVNLYVFDDEGIFVKEYLGRGSALSDPGFKIKLDLNPGNYQFVAWCGLYNGEDVIESFNVPEMISGVSKIDDLTCTLNTYKDFSNLLCSDKRLFFLYHGQIDASLPDSNDGAEYYYTVPLVKDTNHIRLMVQQVSSNLYADQLSINMEVANGEMAYNNNLIGNTEVLYMPWYVGNDVIGTTNLDGIQMEYEGVVADLSTARLMDSQKDDVFITINREDSGEKLFQVPVIQYALTAKKYYEMAYGHEMTNQEFLDRQDEYVLTFFIDERMNLLYTVIDVLEWRVVIHNYDV